MPTDARRRLALGAIIAVLAAAVAIVAPTPTALAQNCEVISCWTECRWVGPHHRQCRRMCRRRCWRPAPRYEPRRYAPEPRYRAPFYAPPAPTRPNPEVLLLGLGAIVIIGGVIIAALTSEDSATDEVNRETEETEQQTAEARMLIADAEAKAREIDAHLDRFLSDTRR